MKLEVWLDNKETVGLSHKSTIYLDITPYEANYLIQKLAGAVSQSMKGEKSTIGIYLENNQERLAINVEKQN